jgi:hypothetical protein
MQLLHKTNFVQKYKLSYNTNNSNASTIVLTMYTGVRGQEYIIIKQKTHLSKNVRSVKRDKNQTMFKVSKPQYCLLPNTLLTPPLTGRSSAVQHADSGNTPLIVPGTNHTIILDI